jgi:Tetracyclin repressor-like, C-terminal domain
MAGRTRWCCERRPGGWAWPPAQRTGTSPIDRHSSMRSARPPSESWPRLWKPSWPVCRAAGTLQTPPGRAFAPSGVATFGSPGLFRTAFSASDNLRSAASPARAGKGGLTPFQLLGAALDELVEAGLLPRERRPDAEFLAWSAVHGLAMLLIEGPLRGLGDARAQDVGQGLIDMVERGL